LFTTASNFQHQVHTKLTYKQQKLKSKYDRQKDITNKNMTD